MSKTPELANLIRCAREVNDRKPLWVIEQVKAALTQFLLDNLDMTARQVRIACYGLAFKPDIDDLRESPALSIAQVLGEELGVELMLVEPNIESLPASLARHQLVDTAYAQDSAHIHVLLVKHREFKSMGALRNDAVVIDAAGVFTAR